jgi:2-polyprenyl-3-methyl-5-hydroxy-6-metoxy-1,4-benzoquinol methylase
MTDAHPEAEHSFDNTYTDNEAMFGKSYQELQTYFSSFSDKGAVLDLGCGQGRDAIFLASVGYQVTAADSSGVGVEQMLKQADLQNLNITGVTQDILSIQTEEKFDVILLDMVLHSFEEEQQAELLQKYTKNLKDDGFFCIIFPDDIANDYFIKMFNSQAENWFIKDEIIIDDIPRVGEEVIDFTFVMQCVKRS